MSGRAEALVPRGWQGAAVLLALAALLAGALLLLGVPTAWLLAPALLALAGLAVGLWPRPRVAGIDGLLFDASRLREGRLRDYMVRSLGYHQQLQALAETFPDPAVRAHLVAGLPGARRTLRASHELCLAMQAYELGESRPPALAEVTQAAAARLTAAAEEVIRATLAAHGTLYTLLRGGWGGGVDTAELNALLGEIAQAADSLRECAAAFADRPSPSATLPTGRTGRNRL